jgi:hypothetical protein
MPDLLAQGRNHAAQTDGAWNYATDATEQTGSRPAQYPRACESRKLTLRILWARVNPSHSRINC